MAAPRKTWRQKLEDSKDLPQVVDIPVGNTSPTPAPTRRTAPAS